MKEKENFMEQEIYEEGMTNINMYRGERFRENKIKD